MTKEISFAAHEPVAFSEFVIDHPSHFRSLTLVQDKTTGKVDNNLLIETSRKGLIHASTLKNRSTGEVNDRLVDIESALIVGQQLSNLSTAPLFREEYTRSIRQLVDTFRPYAVISNANIRFFLQDESIFVIDKDGCNINSQILDHWHVEARKLDTVRFPSRFAVDLITYQFEYPSSGMLSPITVQIGTFFHPTNFHAIKESVFAFIDRDFKNDETTYQSFLLPYLNLEIAPPSV